MDKEFYRTKPHIFQAGKYAVGDPCYMIDDCQWDEVLNRTGWFGYELTKADPNAWDDGVFYHNGYKCFAYGTMHGDGEYVLCSTNKSGAPISKVCYLGVDAGLLGIMPVSAITPETLSYCLEDRSHPMVKIVTMKKDFPVYCVNGFFLFGNYFIDTK